MSVNALSSHGTIIAVQLTPGGAFTNLAEQGDITVPGGMRSEFPAHTQTENVDSYVVSGLMQRGPLKINMNLIPTDPTHDHITGVRKLFNNNTTTGWRSTFPDGTAIISSGKIQALGDIPAPVDGKLTWDVTVRFSGIYLYSGVTVGS